MYCVFNLACKHICHENCRAKTELSCANQMKVRSVLPEVNIFLRKYFMAKDLADRNRWLQGLMFFRKEYEDGAIGKSPISPGFPNPLLMRTSSLAKRPSQPSPIRSKSNLHIFE